VKEVNYNKLVFWFWNPILYNTVATAEYLLSRKVCVCGTLRANRGPPPVLKQESISLLQSWRDTHVVNISPQFTIRIWLMFKGDTDK
jgi:hypothetical protein